MTNFKYLFLFTFLFTFVNVQSQIMTKKERAVVIFTPEEKDNLQMWFHEEVNKMKFTKEEFKQELNKLLEKQNKELQEILTEERFKIHTEIYDVFLSAAYDRWGIVK